MLCVINTCWRRLLDVSEVQWEVVSAMEEVMEVINYSTDGFDGGKFV